MGRVFMVYYDKTPDQSFFLCRVCQAHIALVEDLIFRESSDEPTDTHPLGFFNKIDNVTVDDEAYYRVFDASTESDVHCVNCCALLGRKLIQLIPEETTEYAKAGTFMLHLKMLLIWTKEQILDADTNEPIDQMNELV